MTKRYLYSICFTIIALFFTSILSHALLAQTSDVSIKGVVTDSPGTK